MTSTQKSDPVSSPSVERLRAIIDLQNAIARARLDVDHVMSVVIEQASALTGASGAVVEMVEGDEMVYRAVTGSAAHCLGLRLKRTASLSGLCVDQKTALRSEDTSIDDRVDRAACARVGVASMICVPLFHEAGAIGVLKVLSTRRHGFSAEDLATLQLLAEIIAVSLHQAGQYQTARHDSLHDALTGLGNRRAFDERLAREIDRHNRYSNPLCLALLDLDHFKTVNDRDGHPAGDEVLRQVATILTKRMRTVDACFRIGGDEFAVLLPETSAAGAKLAIGRAESDILATRLGEGTIGVSAGVVEAEGTISAKNLIDRADAVLYETKRAKKKSQAA